MRAYLASLGTTGLLVLSAFAILIAASALLAFNGWPGGGAPDRATPVLIDPGRGTAANGGPVEVAAEAAEAADDVAALPDATPDGGSTPGGGTPGGPGGGTPGGDGDGSPDGGTPDTPTDGTPPGGGGGGDTPPTQPPDRGGIPLPGGGTLLPNGDVSLTDGLADGVESATDFLGDDALSQLSPELGQAVTDTGQVLTDIVRGLDGTSASSG